ncbi:hypothetical protein N752_23055 [Desulforamulus aquiferis]|nr:hypothetical protein [Desulforamulus aquiferis]RYD02893.1 hypothetical protein N752_23055 [Desulforamulus aquiferis]
MDINNEWVSFYTHPEMTNEGVIRHLLAADRQMMRLSTIIIKNLLNSAG